MTLKEAFLFHATGSGLGKWEKFLPSNLAKPRPIPKVNP